MSDRPNVVPIRGTAALAPEPEPEPALVPVTLDWADLRGPAGPRRIHAPDAPAAWRGQVTLTIGCYAVSVPDAVVDVRKYGPPLDALYLTDDQFRALIGRKLDQQTQQAHDDQPPAQDGRQRDSSSTGKGSRHGRNDRRPGPAERG